MPNIIKLRRIWRHRQLRLRPTPARRRRPQTRHPIDTVPIAAVCSRAQRGPQARRSEDAGLIDCVFGQLLVQRNVRLIVDRRSGGRRGQGTASRCTPVARIARGVGGIGRRLLGLEASLGAPAKRLDRQQAGRHDGLPLFGGMKKEVS